MKKQAIGMSVLLATLLGGVAAHAAAPGTFQPVGNTTTPRVFATATLLNDGSVLVAGGWKTGPQGNDWVSQAEAERFDPKTNTFTAVGSMAYPRVSHAAVRLQDGRVLVVGGSNDPPGTTWGNTGELIATAELYDPATGKFAPTGKLITARREPTATLLPNGKVLVVGGWNTDTVETAELYDPATGKFHVTRPMMLGRNDPAAVGLPDGRVVVLGGLHFQNGPQRSVEIFNYRTDTYSLPFDFSPAGQMAEARTDVTAHLLPDGRILVAGGLGGPGDAGGLPTKLVTSVEIYDPATGQSAVTDHLAEGRFRHASVSLADGRVLVLGGYRSLDLTDPNLRLSSAELIDPVTGKVSSAGSMTTFRHNGPVATLLMDGRVLIVGGKGAMLSAEVYIP